MPLKKTLRNVGVRDLFYDPSSIKYESPDDKAYEDIAHQLPTNERDLCRPMDFEPFSLPACRYRRRLRNLDNRRLQCLKRYQEERPGGFSRNARF